MNHSFPHLLAGNVLLLLFFTLVSPLKAAPQPGDVDWPVAWVSYQKGESVEKDFADLKAHGVSVVSVHPGNATEAAQMLTLARRAKMRFEVEVPEITEKAGLVRDAGLEPVYAQMLGGVYRGKAMDRHLFQFEATTQSILIEPPVFDRGLPYTSGSGGTGEMKKSEPIGHYFPGMTDPIRAESVVPLRQFDGQQHLKILPATISLAPTNAKPEIDSVTMQMPQVREIKNRKLYQLSFDLSGLKDARLDQVGVAVYWAYHGSRQYWMFGNGDVSACAASTRQALTRQVQKTLALWREANGGQFPSDVVFAARYGDECFYITGHLNGPAVNYPIWDYSEPAIERYRKQAPALEYPRTWGFPEIYGPQAYACWLYSLHESCAELAGLVHSELAAGAPGLLLFRNTTRAGVFDLVNDHDGSGPELLTRQLDLVHLDPYPVSAAGFNETTIPRDMSYYAGLARRYQKPLVPWMQAHTYGGPSGLQHPNPDQIDLMAAQQYRQGADAVIWLGYGKSYTFPAVNPKSWERAGAFHHLLQTQRPPKPKPTLAVLRGYEAWAQSSLWDGKIRNPADWLLQQWLEVWAVQHGQPYDVFELPPSMTEADRTALENSLKAYAYVVSTVPREGAWVIGQGTTGKAVDPASAKEVRKRFEEEIQQRGWWPAGK